MARINIEESIHTDIKFDRLKLELGSREMAMGTLVYAWILAQKWWKSPERLIPLDEWKRSLSGGKLLIDCGFAEIRQDRVYVRGSEKQFKWLQQRIAAGKKGGKAKKSKNAEIIKESLKRPLSKTKQTEASYSISISTSKKDCAASAACRTESDATPRLPRLARLWNEHRGNLSKVVGCSAQRTRLAEARWKENPSDEYWAGIIQQIACSDFCNGKGERGWRASFDFLVRPDTQHKVLEGKYGTRKTPQQVEDDEFYNSLAKLAGQELGYAHR